MRDIIIIGAGPAGSTCATLLAEAGSSVLVLEKERFPRDHVGESLLPCAVPTLDRLGVDLSAAGYLVKHGAEFVDEASGEQVMIRFAEGYPGFPPSAWQVDRPSFDVLLLERARRAGAEVRLGVRAAKVALGPDAVQVTCADGAEESARYLIDASGQGAFLAKAHRSLAPCHRFGRGAAHARFSGLGEAARAELEPEGNIKILMREGGWAWAIPLAGGELSVGFVLREGPLTPASFQEGMESSPLLTRLTRGAQRGTVHRVGDFSYANLAPHGVRYGCVGDAACFLDPIFSSGVSLALHGAGRLVDLLLPALAAGEEADPDLLAPLSEHLDVSYQTFAAFIDRFYNTRLIKNVFYAEPRDEDLFRGIVGVVSGDLWRGGNPFQNLLLKPSRRGRPWPPELPGSSLSRGARIE